VPDGSATFETIRSITKLRTNASNAETANTTAARWASARNAGGRAWAPCAIRWISKRLREEYGVPWLNLAFDGLEQGTSETRLEAFMYQAKVYKLSKLHKEKNDKTDQWKKLKTGQ